MQMAENVLRSRLSLIKAFIVLAPVFMVCGPAAVAQTASLAQIKQVELDKLERGKQVQLQIETVDDRRIELANEYRSLVKHNASLEQYNRVLRQTIESQQAHRVSLQQQMDSIRNLDREIVPLMVNMLDTLENFVALDIPFLHDERTERIARLRELLRDGNVANSEKYRRILEAYQIENDYGRTIEAYEGLLLQAENGAGERQTVTFLKVGRIAYLYQTLDGSQTYVWSQSGKTWQRLDDSYNTWIEEGIKMAREQIPPDLMFVPVEIPAVLNSAS